jgi:hypothetical protein
VRTTAVLFADAASVREGLLNVLGAGITRLARDPLPGRLDAVLALMLQSDDPEDLQVDHNIEVIITETTADGPTVIAKAVMQLSSTPSSGDPGDMTDLLPTVPLVVPLQNVSIPRTGIYRITTSLDGQEGTAYAFEVVKAPAQLPTGEDGQ